MTVSKIHFEDIVVLGMVIDRCTCMCVCILYHMDMRFEN